MPNKRIRHRFIILHYTLTSTYSDCTAIRDFIPVLLSRWLKNEMRILDE